MSAPMALLTGHSYRYTRQEAGQPSAALPELATVALTADVVSMDAITVPAGTIGTIVGVWGDGSAYEVEFAELDTLATVKAAGLREHIDGE